MLVYFLFELKQQQKWWRYQNNHELDDDGNQRKPAHEHIQKYKHI